MAERSDSERSDSDDTSVRSNILVGKSASSETRTQDRWLPKANQPIYGSVPMHVPELTDTRREQGGGALLLQAALMGHGPIAEEWLKRKEDRAKPVARHLWQGDGVFVQRLKAKISCLFSEIPELWVQFQIKGSLSN